MFEMNETQRIEKLMRDAKMFEIGGGTNEIQLDTIARQLLAREGDRARIPQELRVPAEPQEPAAIPAPSSQDHGSTTFREDPPTRADRPQVRRARLGA